MQHLIQKFDPSRYLPYLPTTRIAETAPESLAILPVGSIEQHGPHLPVGTDLLFGQVFLWEALALVPAEYRMLALPSIAYGRSNEHDSYPGTLSITGIHLYETLIDVGDSLQRAGFRKMLLWNSHGGNRPVVEMAGRDIRARTGLKTFVVNAGLSGGAYPLAASEEDAGLHAGDVETSIMLAAFPDLVDLSVAPSEQPKFTFPPKGEIGFQLESSRGPAVMSWLTEDLTESGILGDPSTATAENGRKAIDRGAAVLARLFMQAAELE